MSINIKNDPDQYLFFYGFEFCPVHKYNTCLVLCLVLQVFRINFTLIGNRICPILRNMVLRIYLRRIHIKLYLLYYMVTQNIKRTHIGEYVISEGEENTDYVCSWSKQMP